MQADFAVELGAEDETLEFPWSSPADGLRYIDLKRQPELLNQLPEAKSFPELSGFLRALNAASGPFETAKCDAWSTTEMGIEDEMFGASLKFGSYVDILFSTSSRFSFPEHDRFARRVVELLNRAPEIPSAAEFLIRRCFYARSDASGFYFSLYVFGYGDDESQARQRWAIALSLVENVIRQATARKED
jgi:hypothetical protein